MKFERKLQVRVALGYIVMLIIGISMVIILVHERKRIQNIESETEDIRYVHRNINAAHRHIIRLAILGEGVIGWDGTVRITVTIMPFVYAPTVCCKP